MLKKIPYPIAGLALGLAALGNLLGSYSPTIRYILGAISAIIVLSLIAKIIKYPSSYSEALTNPVIASSLATFPMAVILLSAYLKPLLPTPAIVLWWIALLYYIVHILIFVKNFILNFNIKKVFPSYFVLFVGIVVSSLTAKPMGFPIVGQIAFYFGLVTYLLMFIPVFRRLFIVKEIPDMAKPTVGIVAAPVSLLLAGYLNAFEMKNPTVVIILLIVAQLMTLFVLVQLPKFITGPFFPSYSSFTFPFVITAIALKGAVGFMKEAMGYSSGILDTLVLIETAIAVILCLYVFVRFFNALFLANKNA